MLGVLSQARIHSCHRLFALRRTDGPRFAWSSAGISLNMAAAASMRTRILDEVGGLALIGDCFLSLRGHGLLQVRLGLLWPILREHRLDVAAGQDESCKSPLEFGVVAPWLVLPFN